MRSLERGKNCGQMVVHAIVLDHVDQTIIMVYNKSSHTSSSLVGGGSLRKGWGEVSPSRKRGIG